jgi:hypothetical protein
MVESYVDGYLDARWSLMPETLEAWSPGDWADRKLASLIDDLKAHTWAAQIPRRIGGEASGQDLSVDKRRLRASAHFLRGLVRGWAPLCPWFDLQTLKDDEITADLRAVGAQLDWLEWNLRCAIDAAEDRAAAVTAALQLGERQWASKVAWLYSREIEDLNRTLLRWP